MALTSTEIRKVFSRPITPIRTSPHYRIRLLGVLLGLAALQLLYLLLIAAVLTFTARFIVVALGSGVALNFITVVFYFGLPVAGCITVLFLLKPILIRPPRPPEPLPLWPNEEPVLFDFIDRLCDALGSPHPSRIYADLRVNASASVHGWRGFFFGDLNLTVGLPLATGLTLSQFTGVLAHEFGHFAQRAGLRSQFLIQTIQMWFARVVHQRDGWDDWLERTRGHGDWRIKVVANLAQLVVNGSRLYLTLLMKAGAWFSTEFSRHMEYDADCHEAAITGAEVFEQTIRQLPILQIGAQLAWQDTEKEWSIRRLPEDFAALVSIRTEYLADETKAQIGRGALGEKTGRWDTHPCASDRIANIRRMGPCGIFDLEGPAARLFRDLEALCREATRHHYETRLRIAASSARFVSSYETLVQTQAARQFDRAATQLFQASPEFWSRWFRLPERDPRDHDIPGQDDSAPQLPAGIFDYDVETNLLHFAALTVAASGVPVKAESFRLNGSDLASIRQEEARSTRNLEEITDQYNRSGEPIARRIETATARLLRGELGVAMQADRPIPLPDLKASWQTYGVLSACQPDVLEIRRRVCALRVVRKNARFFAAATCANLLDRLEHEALSAIHRIVARGAAIPSAICFDERSAATVGAQLTVAGGSATERIEAFLSRFDALSGKALAHLAWFTVAACPIPEKGTVEPV